MVILKYNKQHHKQIIRSAVLALKQGKIVAYPTDTSYGLAADATNTKAVNKLYKIKGRAFNKPVHVVVPSVAYAKKIVRWNKISSALAKKFWPGAVTLVLGLKIKDLKFKKLSAATGFIGLRMSNNKIALDLAKYLGVPITATSANISGFSDSYSAEQIIKQFKNKKHKPDIIISAGKLPKRKPSTIVKVDGERIEILRKGPISKKQVKQALA